MGRFTAAAVGLVLAANNLGAHAASVEVENGVYKLGESNFDAAITKNPTMMVEFYAPWCGHCKELTPKFEKAARKLKKIEGGPRLAKVDATVEENLTKKYEVTSFPTLIVFKDGAHWNYEGAREKEDILKYMETFSLPPPLGAALRGYNAVKDVYKDILRKILPGKVRRFLFKWYVFPIVLSMPLLLLVSCSFCCGRKKTAKKVEDPVTDDAATQETKPSKGKTSSRSKSPSAGSKKEKEDGEKKDD